MYGYHGKRILDFLRITMAMPRLIAPAKRLLEQGLKSGPFPLHFYQAFEANIDFEIRWVHLFLLWYWRLASIRKLLISNISVYTLAQWRVAAGVEQSFKILKEFAVSPGLWSTLMWWDAAGLNYLKESIKCEKRMICRSLIPSAWAR